MVWNPQRLDPDRHRRRLEILAALANAKTLRERARSVRQAGQFVMSRRGVAG
jgi:hypothetical protein